MLVSGESRHRQVHSGDSRLGGGVVEGPLEAKSWKAPKG